MSRKDLTKEFLKRSNNFGQSPICAQQFSRSQRTTHQSLASLRSDIKSEMTSSFLTSQSKRFIVEKSSILNQVDSNLEEKVKRKTKLQKLNTKISIISMQKTKFKVNKSSFKMDSKISTKSFKISGLVPQRHTQKPLTSLQNSTLRAQVDCDGYALSSELQQFRSYLKIVLLNHPKQVNERKTEIFSRCLLNYFITVGESELKKDLQQIKKISEQLVCCLSSNQYSLNMSHFRFIDRDISKLAFNICYEIYRKKQKGVSARELLKINKEIEYTSRRLKFFQLTLRTIFDLGQLHCDQMQYEKAFQEYTHAAKLAIFIDSKYYQQVAIDKLGLCKYYMGDSVSALYFHNNINYMSNYDLNRIKTEYSNQNQINRLIEKKYSTKNNKSPFQRTCKVSKTDIIIDHDQTISNQSFTENINIGQFTFQKENRNQFYPMTNNLQLKSSLQKIIKVPQLRQKMNVIKRSIKKNDSIGAKTYYGQHYLLPSPSRNVRKENSFEVNEVCLSHRSFNRNDISINSAVIDRDCRVLVATLNYFINLNFFNKNTAYEAPGENL